MYIIVFDPNAYNAVDRYTIKWVESMCNIGPDYGRAASRYEIKTQLERLNKKESDLSVAKTVPCACAPVKKNTPEKENTMYANAVALNATVDTDAAKREFLRSEAREIKYSAPAKIHAAFNLNTLPSPKTPKELADYIAKGYLTVKNTDDETKANTKFSYGEWFYGIEWRDPAKPADKAGAEAAEKAFAKLYTDTKRTIVLKDPATDGLNAVIALEAWTPTGKAN